MRTKYVKWFYRIDTAVMNRLVDVSGIPVKDRQGEGVNKIRMKIEKERERESLIDNYSVVAQIDIII